MTAIEWVPGQWDQVTAGDRVKLVHDDGEQAIIGTAAYNYSADIPIFSWPKGAGNICFHANDAEWSLFVEAPTKPELPTEPGLYRLNNSIGNGMVVELTHDGDWLSPNHSKYMDDEVGSAQTFERLAPVAETLARHLPQLEEIRACIARSVLIDTESSTSDIVEGRRILNNLIAEFGVTGETNQ